MATIPAYELHLKKIDRYNYEESDFDEDELPLKEPNCDHLEILFADIERYNYFGEPALADDYRRLYSAWAA
jgi:hypothetical protein